MWTPEIPIPFTCNSQLQRHPPPPPPPGKFWLLAAALLNTHALFFLPARPSLPFLPYSPSSRLVLSWWLSPASSGAHEAHTLPTLSTPWAPISTWKQSSRAPFYSFATLLLFSQLSVCCPLSFQAFVTTVSLFYVRPSTAISFSL